MKTTELIELFSENKIGDKVSNNLKFEENDIKDIKDPNEDILQFRREKSFDFYHPPQRDISIDAPRSIESINDINEIYFPEITPSKISHFQRPTTISPKWKRNTLNDISLNSE